MSFADLGLSDELLQAIIAKGYDTPTPIQAQAIPSVLMMRDLIAIAQTGTGKTASFVLPMIDILAHGRRRAMMPRSLILEPTRELAAQVAENFEAYGKNHDLKMALLIGGVQMGDQVKALNEGVDVLIATPGRLMDLFERGKILLTGCDLLVIDDGSTDRTAARARRAGVMVASLPFNQGVGAAHQTGYIFALAHGYEACGQIDGDGQHPASELVRLVAVIESGDADLVVGSRFAGR